MTRSDTSRSSRIVLRTPDAGPRRPDGVPTGQHAAWHPVPWHQRALVALIAVGLLAGLFVAGVRTWDAAPPCVPVRIVAAPEVAPLVADVAARLDHAEGCAFSVVPRSSTDEAQALVGGPDGPEPPHVWMPESTLQLAQARAQGATAVPPSGVSVVATPVVMALAADAVGKLGPGRPTGSWVGSGVPTTMSSSRSTSSQVGLPGPSLPTASAASAITTGVATTDTPAGGTDVAPLARACASCRVDSGIQTCGRSGPPGPPTRACAASADSRGTIENAQPAAWSSRAATWATSGATSGAATIRTGAHTGAASQVRTPATTSPASSPAAISATRARWCHGTGCHAACCPVGTPSGRRGPASGVRSTMREEPEVSVRVTPPPPGAGARYGTQSRPEAFPG